MEHFAVSPLRHYPQPPISPIVTPNKERFSNNDTLFTSNTSPVHWESSVMKMEHSEQPPPLPRLLTTTRRSLNFTDQLPVLLRKPSNQCRFIDHYPTILPKPVLQNCYVDEKENIPPSDIDFLVQTSTPKTVKRNIFFQDTYEAGKDSNSEVDKQSPKRAPKKRKVKAKQPISLERKERKNKIEKERIKRLGNAFQILKNLLPATRFDETNQPVFPRTHYEIVQGAINYMKTLQQLLD